LFVQQSAFTLQRNPVVTHIGGPQTPALHMPEQQPVLVVQAFPSGAHVGAAPHTPLVQVAVQQSLFVVHALPSGAQVALAPQLQTAGALGQSHVVVP
jgi:hypothetical protein